MLKKIFITGTDTGIGKTAISAGIAGALKNKGYNVGVIKPIQSGAASRNGKLYSQDIDFIIKASGCIDGVCPILLKEALAPSVAAKIEGKIIDLELIKSAYLELEKRNDFVIVEGAGGISVPLKDNFLISDLIKFLDIPIIIVARAGLGTINHTFLTVEYARKCNIDIIGVIINDFKGGIVEETNPEVIEKLTGIKILGIVPHDDGLNTENGETGNIVSLVEKYVKYQFDKKNK